MPIMSREIWEINQIGFHNLKVNQYQFLEEKWICGKVKSLQIPNYPNCLKVQVDDLIYIYKESLEKDWIWSSKVNEGNFTYGYLWHGNLELLCIFIFYFVLILFCFYFLILFCFYFFIFYFFILVFLVFFKNYSCNKIYRWRNRRRKW